MMGKLRCTKPICWASLIVSVNLLVLVIYWSETSRSILLHPRYVISSSKRLLFSITRMTTGADEPVMNVTQIPLTYRLLNLTKLNKNVHSNKTKVSNNQNTTAVPSIISPSNKVHTKEYSRITNGINVDNARSSRRKGIPMFKKFRTKSPKSRKYKRIKLKKKQKTNKSFGLFTTFPPTTMTSVTKKHTGVLLNVKSINAALRIQAKNEPKLIPGRKYDNPGVRQFKRAVTDAQAKDYVDILEIFHELCLKENLTYMMYSGTLLGSYRFHGFIPWDDDIDILMPHDQRQKLDSLTMPSGFQLVTAQGTRWKFSRDTGPLIRNLAWRWPFVDISFYKENGEVIWDIDSNYMSSFTYNKSIVYPLIRRPFETRWFYAPKETEKFLKTSYDLENCATNSYNHQKEYVISASNQFKRKCDSLRPYYAMVNRTNTNDGFILESLVFNETVIQDILFET